MAFYTLFADTIPAMAFAATSLRQFLSELADALLLENAEPQEWLLCGGAALTLHGFISRATRDVDVLCGGDRNGAFVALKSFSSATERAIRRVAEAHPELSSPIGSTWVNLGASKLAEWGLPEGYESRLTGIVIGERLTLYLLGRPDLIALKLFAASDDLGPRQAVHESDLRALAPTETEMERATAWVKRMPDPQNRIAPALKDIVEEFGFHELASYL
jgi:Nucleotidyl transferase AbiEii toxin, Type IV TA system